MSVGSTVAANLDYVGDLDYFLIDLVAGVQMTIKVESINFDPIVGIALDGAFLLAFDDDSGGGLLGLNARLTFTPDKAGTYLIVVNDAQAFEAGGYFLSMSRPSHQQPMQLSHGRFLTQHADHEWSGTLTATEAAGSRPLPRSRCYD